jgi:hypothetical protein
MYVCPVMTVMMMGVVIRRVRYGTCVYPSRHVNGHRHSTHVRVPGLVAVLQLLAVNGTSDPVMVMVVGQF